MADEGRDQADQGAAGPIRALLEEMTAASLDRSSLDSPTLMLVRLAALVAVDAPPLSYLLNLEAADAVGITADQVEGVLAAVAPIVGTTRIVAAGSKMERALGLAIAVAAAEDAADADGASGAPAA